MEEIFVIYDKNTGFIDGGAGKIDREWDSKHYDGSTTSENIPRTLAKNSNKKVIYFPVQDVPKSEEFMVKNGRLKKMNRSEAKAYKATLPKTKTQEFEERIAMLETKI